MDLDESVHLTELTPVILESSDGQQTEVKVAWHSVPVTFQHLSSVTNQYIATRITRHDNYDSNTNDDLSDDIEFA